MGSDDGEIIIGVADIFDIEKIDEYGFAARISMQRGMGTLINHQIFPAHSMLVVP